MVGHKVTVYAADSSCTDKILSTVLGFKTFLGVGVGGGGHLL